MTKDKKLKIPCLAVSLTIHTNLHTNAAPSSVLYFYCMQAYQILSACVQLISGIQIIISWKYYHPEEFTIFGPDLKISI